MGMFEISLLAIALSMDAFAVAVCAGLSGGRARIKTMLTVGIYFGVAQAVMPIIGFFLAAWFSEYITAYSGIIAFAILVFLGIKMIWGSFKKGEDESVDTSPSKMLPLAVATSIDAMAVGVSFAFLSVNIFRAALFIGVTTFVLSAVGVKVGSLFGTRFKSAAEFMGGIILVFMGVAALG